MSPKVKTILITGSSGSIGTAICKKLISEGHDVIPLDLLKNKWDENINNKTVSLDLRDSDSIRKIPKADFVIHLAANSRVPDSVIDPNLAKDNFLTTFNMLEYSRLNKVPFIFASSREVYGDGVKQSYQEDDVLLENCSSPYGASKIAGESLINAYSKCYKLEAVIVRFSNVYGRYDEYDRVVPTFIRKMLKNEDITIFNGDKVLDFLYIDDAAKALSLCISNFDVAKGKVFNIGTGKGTKLIELAKLIRAATNTKSNVRLQENRIGEVVHFIANISKAQKVLNFSPSTDITEGIKKAVEWYSN